MKNKLDPSNTEQNEHFLEVTNQILEKIKTTKHNRVRSISISRSESSKRGRSKENKSFEDRPGHSILFNFKFQWTNKTTTRYFLSKAVIIAVNIVVNEESKRQYQWSFAGEDHDREVRGKCMKNLRLV